MIKKIVAALVIIVITAMVSHVWTMQNLCVETNGNNTIVKTVSGYWYYEGESTDHIGQSLGAIM